MQQVAPFLAEAQAVPRLLEKAVLFINETACALQIWSQSPEDFEAPDQDLMAAAVDLLAAVVEGLQTEVLGLLRQHNFLCVLPLALPVGFLALGQCCRALHHPGPAIGPPPAGRPGYRSAAAGQPVRELGSSLGARRALPAREPRSAGACHRADCRSLRGHLPAACLRRCAAGPAAGTPAASERCEFHVHNHCERETHRAQKLRFFKRCLLTKFGQHASIECRKTCCSTCRSNTATAGDAI